MNDLISLIVIPTESRFSGRVEGRVVRRVEHRFSGADKTSSMFPALEGAHFESAFFMST